MSEFTWYSRLAVLGGVLVLIVQSVSGRAVGALTVLAVLAVFFGLIAFLGGLAYDGSGPAAAAIDLVDDAPKQGNTEVKREDDAQPAVNQTPAEAEPPQPEHEEQTTAPIDAAGARSEAVSTFRVDDDLAGRLLPCPACGRVPGAGQIGARCGVCGSVHHASCWIDTDFHCAAPGCSGAGSLEAPGPVPASLKGPTGGTGPRGGPSKP